MGQQGKMGHMSQKVLMGQMGQMSHMIYISWTCNGMVYVKGLSMIMLDYAKI